MSAHSTNGAAQKSSRNTHSRDTFCYNTRGQHEGGGGGFSVIQMRGQACLQSQKDGVGNMFTSITVDFHFNVKLFTVTAQVFMQMRISSCIHSEVPPPNEKPYWH